MTNVKIIREKYLKNLADRRKAIKAYFDAGHTMNETGMCFGITKQAVFKILKDAKDSTDLTN